MGVVLLKCHKCGRNYAIGNMKCEDAHKCECGEILKWHSNYIGSCDCAPLYPNMPAEKPAFPAYGGSTLAWHGDNSPEWIPPKKLTKKVTIDVKAEKGFKKLMKDINNASKKISKMPGIAFANNDGSVSVVPIISVDTKALIFQSDVALITRHKKELEKEYTKRTGIECIILDGRAKLAAVIDG